VSDSYDLCRCGKSGDKPFCDGAHAKARFNGTETASRRSFARQAETTVGPTLVLKDAEPLCASTRFCLPRGGTWDLVLESDDRVKRKTAIRQACNCPSGRLVVHDRKTGKPLEPTSAPSISLIEDPLQRVSGPIWVKGRVRVESADGRVYEARSRVTLCRCGKSQNKPFCDGRHVKARFNDGDESLNR
jgi:CDGSH-type Zn-finger protein